MKKVFKILFLIIILGSIAFAIYYAYNTFFKSNNTRITVSTIDGYDYKLTSNKNSYYKKLFKELKKILEEDEVNEEEYAKLVSQLFVTDFFSLEDKYAKNDIGGVEFVLEEEVTDYKLKAEETYYKYVENNLNKTRRQKLPSVSKVTIEDITQDSFDYKVLEEEKNDANAYIVKVSIKYSSSEFDNYQDSANLIIVHKDKKLYIVEMNN